jgi:hypothetical protein
LLMSENKLKCEMGRRITEIMSQSRFARVMDYIERNGSCSMEL